jgi:glucose-1-phosphate adenylyltransferase
MNRELAQSLDLPRRAVALVLAGGRGSRLKNLTDNRAKPAVYFGGKFRIVDFALSNCMNSGIRRIGVITQYKSHSLLRHLQRGWAFLKSEMNEFVDLLPAQQRVDEESWYRGTADAVYQNQDIVAGYRADYVVVLAGDHVYKMNYALMLADHVARGRECTVGCIEVPRAEASAFGVMAVDGDNGIVDFVEKPADPPAMPGKPDRALASMGIYIFNGAAARPSSLWSRAAASSRARPTARCCFPRSACIRTPWSKARCCCPACRSGATHVCGVRWSTATA